MAGETEVVFAVDAETVGSTTSTSVVPRW